MNTSHGKKVPGINLIGRLMAIDRVTAGFDCGCMWCRARAKFQARKTCVLASHNDG